MQYLCPLPEALKSEASAFVEFANGGAQATVMLNDGRVFTRVLVSNGSAIVAARGFTEPPFATADITRIDQTDEDKDPDERGGWHYWDEWGQHAT
jgi:hypothetical protein